jgi:hypothetical protein
MSDDEFDRIASIPPAKVKDLYAAGQLAAKMLHADPGRYAELLATLQNNGHKRLTDWDRHVKRTVRGGQAGTGGGTQCRQCPGIRGRQERQDPSDRQERPAGIGRDGRRAAVRHVPRPGDR